MDPRRSRHSQLRRETLGLNGRFRRVGNDNGMHNPGRASPTDHVQPVSSELLVRKVAVRIDEHGRRIAN